MQPSLLIILHFTFHIKAIFHPLHILEFTTTGLYTGAFYLVMKGLKDVTPLTV
jgi:hypothetical protein